MLQRLLRRAETSGRVDDNKETFEMRYQGFLHDSVPVLDFFEFMGLLVRVSSLEQVLDHTKIGRLTANVRWMRYMIISKKASR